MGGSPAVAPRLLSLQQAAAYLGVSYWTMRDWVLAGDVATMDLPPLRPREGERQRKTLRRVLVDRQDLDAFIDALKTGRARDFESRAPRIEAGTTGRNAAPVPNAVPALCPEDGR